MSDDPTPNSIDPVSSPEDSTPPDAATSGEPVPPTAAELKSAYNAFKKRWKLTRLDHDSRIGRSPLSSGGKGSSIVGIAGPREFPKAVWEELVNQGRLKRAGSGLYSMP
jgi:hypothetical protein